MITPKNPEDLEKIKPPFFVKEADPMMAKLYYSEQELGYNEQGQAWVKSDLAWVPFLTLSRKDVSNRDTPFEQTHAIPVLKEDWIFLAHAGQMEDGKLKVYTEQGVFQQAIKSIFEGAVAKRQK